MSGKILALDVSETSTGVCEGRPGETPLFSRMSFLPAAKPGEEKPKGNEDHRGAARRAFDWLDRKLETDPEILTVIMEAPARPQAFQGSSSAATLITTLYLAGALMLACHRNGVKWIEATPNNVRAVFLGAGTLTRTQAKSEAKRVCLAIGWTPRNADEADAGALWWCQANSDAPGSVPDVRPFRYARIDENGVVKHTAARKPARPRAPEEVQFKAAA